MYKTLTDKKGTEYLYYLSFYSRRTKYGKKEMRN